MEHESKGEVRKGKGNKHKELVPAIQKEPVLTNVNVDKNPS